MHHASLYHYNLPDQQNLRLTPAYDPTITAVNSFIGLGVYYADTPYMESRVLQSAFYLGPRESQYPFPILPSPIPPHPIHFRPKTHYDKGTHLTVAAGADC